MIIDLPTFLAVGLLEKYFGQKLQRKMKHVLYLVCFVNKSGSFQSNLSTVMWECFEMFLFLQLANRATDSVIK